MNLELNSYNLQIQKTSLKFDSKLQKIDETKQLEQQKNEPSNKELEDNSNVSQNNVLLDPSQLTQVEKLKKNVLQTVLSGYGIQGDNFEFIPKDAFNFSFENTSSNPYSKSLELSPNSLAYSSTDEYYEKTTLEFSGEVIINTPNGKYSLELNFSYTNEYYEKNVQEVELMKQNMKTPFNMKFDTDEYDSAIKDLKGISVLFDVINEEDEKQNKSLMDYLKEQLIKNQEDKKQLEEQEEKRKHLDNFKAYIQEQNSSYTLAAIKQGDIGIFFADFKSESLKVSMQKDGNSSSISASYTSVESSYLEIKA